MKTVAIRYGVIFGKGDSSDWIDYEFDLTDEEAAAYDNAVANEIPLEDVRELQIALKRAYSEVEEVEIQNLLDCGDEYVLECRGLALMDEDELNDLVHKHDPHALAFFELEDASNEEIEEWDAYDLDDIPTIEEFDEDFESCSPFDAGWILNVEFVDPNNDW